MTEKKRQLADGRERWEGVGRAKSYDGEKAWSSINHSILSDLHDNSNKVDFHCPALHDTFLIAALSSQK
jgi:hypothetical protein